MNIDVLIPCKNPKENLLGTINSLDKISEINKIFIIDDYSINNESTYNFIENNFKKVIVIKNIYKKGISGALNTGLNFSKSKYIARIDCGDICISKNRFKKILKVFVMDNKIDLVCTGIIGKNDIKLKPRIIKSNGILSPFSRVPHPTWIFKKDSIKFKYNERFVRFEDYAFLIENNLRIFILNQFDILYETETLLNRKLEIEVALKKVYFFIKKAHFHFSAIFIGLFYLVLRLTRLMVSRVKIFL